VLVELTDQRVHPVRVEAGPLQAVERGEDSDIGWIAAKGATPEVRQLLDVVGTDVPRTRLEGHDVAQLGRRHLLSHHADQRSIAVGNRRDHAIGDRHRGRGQRRLETDVEGLQQSAQNGADQEPEGRLQRAQAEHPQESTADDRGEKGFIRAVDQAHQPAEQCHQQNAAQDPVPERLRLGGAPGHAGDHLGRRVQRRTDQGARAGPDPVDRIAEHGTRSGAQRRSPDQRVETPAGTASSASVRMPHARGAMRGS
jgi:hypothetical protein